MSAGTDNESQICTGKDPKGSPVSYFEVDRPGSVGAKGSQGFVIEVRGADGKRITHSDSLAGLKKAGYTVDVPAPAPTPVEKSLEDELAS